MHLLFEIQNSYTNREQLRRRKCVTPSLILMIWPAHSDKLRTMCGHRIMMRLCKGNYNSSQRIVAGLHRYGRIMVNGLCFWSIWWCLIRRMCENDGASCVKVRDVCDLPLGCHPNIYWRPYRVRKCKRPETDLPSHHPPPTHADEDTRILDDGLWCCWACLMGAIDHQAGQQHIRRGRLRDLPNRFMLRSLSIRYGLGDDLCWMRLIGSSRWRT